MKVRFALLGTLVCTGRRRDPWRHELLPAAFFTGVHLTLVALVGLAAPTLEPESPTLESVTYLDIPTPN